MSKFKKFKGSCAASEGKKSASVESGAHIKLTAKQCLQALRRGEGQMALTLHVEGERKKAFAQHVGDITVEVNGVEGPISLRKVDHNVVWVGNQVDETGFESLFNLLFTDDFESKVNGLLEVEDETVRRQQAKKVKSVLPATISFDVPVPSED